MKFFSEMVSELLFSVLRCVSSWWGWVAVAKQQLAVTSLMLLVTIIDISTNSILQINKIPWVCHQATQYSFRCLQWRTCLLRFEVLWRRWFPPTKKCCKNGRWGTAHRWRQVLDNFEIISIIQVALAEDLGLFVSWPSWLYSCLLCSQAKIQRTSFGKSSICWGHLHLPQVEVELSNCVNFVS